MSNACGENFRRTPQRIKNLSKPTTLMRAAKRLALFACVIAALTVHVAAQTGQTQSPTSAPAPASPSPQPTATPAAATDNHDLSITANVTARELLFEVVPNPKVEFTGRPRRNTVWEAERTNLPAQVQPGVTYRDIGIRLRITSVFADIERIVAEALGEIPASDDAPPRQQPQQQVEPGTNAAPPPQTNNAILPTQPVNATPPPDNTPTTMTGTPQAGAPTTTPFTTPAQTSRTAPAGSVPARVAPRRRGRL
ncbi:MAG TPA: hypothetical protein VER76_00745 [Pyrinomonadaceae bacterium]|nr:hypothetical protein [Pyrinomonadaceae bacterium]